jgi:CRISPR-associated endonuclease/helicase Cas3
VSELNFFKYWAKTPSDDVAESYIYHPLVYHSLDVAACAEALLNASPRFLTLMAETFGATDIASTRKTVVLLAALHDIGKFAASFQSLSIPICEHLDRTPIPPGGYSRKKSTAHDSLGLWFWIDRQIAELFFGSTDPDVSKFLATGTFGHHGTPVSADMLFLNKLDGKNGCFPRRDVEAALSFLNVAIGLIGGPLAIPVDGKHAKRASFLIAAIVNAADWLGSNSAVFEYTKPDEDTPLENYWTKARSRAAGIVCASGLVPAQPRANGGFASMFPNVVPSPLQAAADTLSLPAQFLLILEDAAGAGKTEAALTIAARTIATGNTRGLFFGLPTTATADAQAVRQAVYYKMLFANDQNPSMSVAHSATRTGTVAIEDANCADWISDDRRRRLMADVCVGTVDQALLAALPSKFVALRLFGLAGKVLVLDEVHSYDKYTTQLITSLLEMHAALGGSAVLLSATLTGKTKNQLADAFAKGARFKKADASDIANPNYPLITTIAATGSSTVAPARAKHAPPDKKIKMVYSIQEVQEAILSHAQAGRCVLWVRNTVDSTIEAGKYLKQADPGIEVTVFHARYPDVDRQKIQTEVLSRFGKHGDPSRRARNIVVATAVIEQSLDLDFDVVVVDLKPMDAIIQALGRGIRHRRGADGALLHANDTTADQRSEIEMIVVSPDPDVVKNSNWYSDFLGSAQNVQRNPSVLWRTAMALKRLKTVTYSTVRSLVEEAYNESIEVPLCLLAATDIDEGAGMRAKSDARRLSSGMTPETGYDVRHGFWEDTRVPTREGESIEIILVRSSSDGSLSPYKGHDWRSGRMTIRLHRGVKKTFESCAIPDSLKIMSKFSLIVPVKSNNSETSVFHDGSIVPSFICDSQYGLNWIK